MNNTNDLIREGVNLETIGKKIKAAREDMGLSIEDVSKKTKLLIPHLKAIEAGNVDFFKQDLSYLAYYVRYYANAVNLDYDEIRDDLDKIILTTTQSLDVSEIRKRIDINDGIRGKRHEQGDIKNIKTTISKKRKRIDFSFVSFVLAALVLVILLIFVGVKYLPGWFNSEPIEKPPIVIPDTNDKTPDTEEPDEPSDIVDETPNVSLTYVEPNIIEVSGLTQADAFELEVKFTAPQTWIAVRVNNQQVADPVSKTYAKGESIVYSDVFEGNKEVMFHMGIMLGNEFYLNGERVTLDDAVQNSNGVTKVYFRFVEEGA